MFGKDNFSITATSTYAKTDTGEFRDTIINQNIVSILRDSVGISNYEDIIYGDVWILTVRILSLSSYTADSQLLVTALQRSEIFGQIETATRYSKIIAIAIAITVGTLIAGIYIIIVLPIFKLAKAMNLLTKFDFSTLENSKMLDNRSVIWELRKLQDTFATMCRSN
ncbi:hypothetical protein HK096_006559 [Nowakowskiella sp. JEL0078]|nr:hypothetical protein HK096_006559 [Nowakowskiella sp. JEL0078]